MNTPKKPRPIPPKTPSEVPPGRGPDEFAQAFGENFEDEYEPLFSVIIAGRNMAERLPDTVASLLRQGGADFETIVINGGSTDGSAALARALADKHPELGILVIEQEDQGLAISRNIGIAAASGRWIAPLDCGDRMAEHFLGNVTRAIEEFPQANAFTGACQPFSAKPAGTEEAEEQGKWKFSHYDAQNLKERCSLLANTVYRRGLWLASGGYDASHPYGMEDWHFWLKAQLHGFTPVCLPVPMVHYRKDDEAASRAMRRHQADAIALHQTMLTEVYPLNTVMAAQRQLLRMNPETEEAVRQKLARLPKNPMPHFWLGLAHEGRGDLAEAAACYRAALALPWARLGQSFKSGAWQPQMRLDQLQSGRRAP
jgi:hypothetical protein